MAGKKSKMAESSAKSAPKADATRKNLRLAKLERSGVANDGRLLFLDIVDDTGAAVSGAGHGLQHPRHQSAS